MGGIVKSVAKGVGSIFGGGQPAAPVVESPKAAPVPQADDEAARRNARKRQSQVAARSGRASTILSDGGSYSGETLG